MVLPELPIYRKYRGQENGMLSAKSKTRRLQITWFFQQNQCKNEGERETEEREIYKLRNI